MKLSLVFPVLFALSPLSRAGQVSIPAAADNTIYSESGALSNGAGNFLFAGENGVGNPRRALLRFDVANSIPAGATIISVQLMLHMSQTTAGPTLVTVHRLSSSWGEAASHAPGSEGGGGPAMPNDVTWTERFFGAGQPWSAPGADFGTVETSLTVNGVGTYTFPSTLLLVLETQQMLDLPFTDAGWMVIGDETAPSTAKRFDSRENTTAGVQPQLIVDFAPPCTNPTSNYCTAAPNSAGPGAHITWYGSQSVAFNGFQLSTTGLPTSPTGIYYCGPTQTNVPFGNGVRCVSGTVHRLGTISTIGTGPLVQQPDFTTSPASVITASSTWNFQLWYRDTAAGGAGFNLSDGLSVTFCP